jgi:hypothetical protein
MRRYGLTTSLGVVVVLVTVSCSRTEANLRLPVTMDWRGGSRAWLEVNSPVSIVLTRRTCACASVSLWRNLDTQQSLVEPGDSLMLCEGRWSLVLRSREGAGGRAEIEGYLRQSDSWVVPWTLRSDRSPRYMVAYPHSGRIPVVTGMTRKYGILLACQQNDQDAMPESMRASGAGWSSSLWRCDFPRWAADLVPYELTLLVDAKRVPVLDSITFEDDLGVVVMVGIDHEDQGAKGVLRSLRGDR